MSDGGGRRTGGLIDHAIAVARANRGSLTFGRLSE
jgi:hypothetical protein